MKTMKAMKVARKTMNATKVGEAVNMLLNKEIAPMIADGRKVWEGRPLVREARKLHDGVSVVLRYGGLYQRYPRIVAHVAETRKYGFLSEMVCDIGAEALLPSLATTTTDAVTRYKEFGGAYTEADADWVAVRLEGVRVELGPEQSHEEADSRLEDGDDTRGQVRAAARRVTASLLMAPLRQRGVAPGHHLRCTKGARNMTQATKATRAMKAGVKVQKPKRQRAIASWVAENGCPGSAEFVGAASDAGCDIVPCCTCNGAIPVFLSSECPNCERVFCTPGCESWHRPCVSEAQASGSRTLTC
jgi:ASC-1-like (ASCH) protein